MLDNEGQDNIIAALKHHDRIIRIYFHHYLLEPFSAVTRKPFPVLTEIDLTSSDKIVPVLHEEFLGGPVPHLREIILLNIAFPAFPKFALSCSSLSEVTLWFIPSAGYLSPEAMATCLATFPSLEYLDIQLQYSESRPDRIGLPPPIRSVLPALHRFNLQGVGEYLEDLVALIDTPELRWLRIGGDMFNIDVPQLHKFIVRSQRFGSLNPAEIIFSPSATEIILGLPSCAVNLQIVCRETNWRTSSMVQVCSQLSPLLSHVEQLYIHGRAPGRGQGRQLNGTDPTEILELFVLFPSVRRLHIFGELRPFVARALQELKGESAAEVLPSLRGLVFRVSSPSGSIQKDIQGF